MNGANPLLTIGMATFQDFNGVYFSIQSIRLNNPDLLDKVEFVVVDNSPDTEDSQMIRGLLGNIASTGTRVKYVAMKEPQGTSPAREKIFEESTGEYVLCMDCHVLLDPDALPSLIRFYQNNPKSKDILTGPMLYDPLAPGAWATHFGNKWRGEMWGIWENIWLDDSGMYFAVNEQEGKCNPVSVSMLRQDLSSEFPAFPKDLGWAGHEKVLLETGFHLYGTKESDPKYIDIPGQGLGLFSCRRKAWQHFHPEARGFGGEELWIHEKFRRAGGRAYCLKGLKWLHRFGRPGGFKYSGVTAGRKMRNYVLEFNELGMDLSPIHEHFVNELGIASQAEWEQLVKDPVNWKDGQITELSNDPIIVQASEQSSCGGCGNKAEPKLIETLSSVDEVFDIVSRMPRDLEQHMPKIRELCLGVDSVTEVSNRKESTIAIFAAKPKKFVSYNPEFESLSMTAAKLTKNVTEFTRINNMNTREITAIEETDVLFLDSEHTYERLFAELNQFHNSVKHYIIIHDTDIFGNQGQDGGKGLLPAIAQFCRKEPKWSVVYLTKEQYGLTVLSCKPEDKPKLPPLGTRLWNFAKAAVEHAAKGADASSEELVEQRLNVCMTCPHRNNTACSLCGCVVAVKATWKEQDCPIAKWPREEDLVQLSQEEGEEQE